MPHSAPTMPLTLTRSLTIFAPKVARDSSLFSNPAKIRNESDSKIIHIPGPASYSKRRGVTMADLSAMTGADNSGGWRDTVPGLRLFVSSSIQIDQPPMVPQVSLPVCFSPNDSPFQLVSFSVLTTWPLPNYSLTSKPVLARSTSTSFQ